MALEFKPIDSFRFPAKDGEGIRKQCAPLLKTGDNEYLFQIAAYIQNGVVTVELLRAEEV